MTTQNSSGMMNGLPPVGQKDRKIGPIVGALIIIILIIVAALYFFGKKMNTTESIVPADAIVETTATTETTSDTNLSTSTDVNAIQADLDAQLNDVDYSF